MTRQANEDTPVVSVVVPTLNAASLIDACLSSIVAQSYHNVELIVVDGHSRDDTVARARAHTDKVFEFGPSQAGRRIFGAPVQRNYGASRASGAFVYYVDADMVLPPTLIEECVRQARTTGADALIVPERSVGTGFWAEVKAMERECYVGDDLVEAPRFISADAWRSLNGLDTSMGGNDDWDLHNRLRDGGWVVGRVSQEVLHNEGHLRLGRLAKKRFLYGRYIPHFLGRYGVRRSMRHYNPFRRYFARRSFLAKRPLHLLGLLTMRSVEYAAGGAGLLIGLVTSRTSAEEAVPTDSRVESARRTNDG